MTQMRATAIAAFALGVGLAGEPFVIYHAAIAAAVLALATFVLERRTTPLTLFLFGFVGLIFARWFQHREIFVPAIVVAIGLGALAASSYGRRNAPAAIAIGGVVLGIVVYLLGPF